MLGLGLGSGLGLRARARVRVKVRIRVGRVRVRRARRASTDTNPRKLDASPRGALRSAGAQAPCWEWPGTAWPSTGCCFAAAPLTDSTLRTEHADDRYNYGLLLLCFCAGLLGGGVYVNAFTLISSELAAERQELALATTSVADTLGVLAADVAGLFLQSCLYRHHGIAGAAVRCPLR